MVPGLSVFNRSTTPCDESMEADPVSVGKSGVVVCNDIVRDECKAVAPCQRPALATVRELYSETLTPSFKTGAGSSKLYLRLYDDGGTCLMMERRFEAVDKSRTTLILPIKTLAMLREFIDNDEFYGQFSTKFEHIYKLAASEFTESDLQSLKELSFEGDPVKALKTIKKIRSESTLIEAVWKWIRIFGAEYFTYARIVRDHQDPDIENRLWMVGFSPAYAQIYNQCRWYENDPYVLRARTTDEPFCGHETPTMSDGQARLREVGHRYGINALIVIPVHGHNNAHIGLLYVCLDTERMSGEAMLQEHQFHFQMLAREIHNWWGERVRVDAVQKYELDELEIGLLGLVQNGVVLATEQAQALDVPATKIYKVNQCIKKKFGTTDLRAAARMASVYGLIK